MSEQRTSKGHCPTVPSHTIKNVLPGGLSRRPNGEDASRRDVSPVGSGRAFSADLPRCSRRRRSRTGGTTNVKSQVVEYIHR
ncbi:hypothetical protein NJ7G_2652 [Natrinema sp. J7-2]|nr:hypothetical protein NJ7G_2652 [Natrinema sp. J7-2]